MVAHSISFFTPISSAANRRIALNIVDRCEDPDLAVSRREYLVSEISGALDACCRHVPPTPSQNVEIARHIVEEIVNFKSIVPFGKSWQAFAVAEVLVGLNRASRGRG